MPSVAAKFRRIALIGKLRSPEVEASLGEIRKFLSSRGCEVLKDGAGADLAVVVGGEEVAVDLEWGVGSDNVAVFHNIREDVELDKIPSHLLKEADPVFEFNRQIIEATHDLCVAYKPNLAFYEALGAEGWRCFERTVECIGKEHFIIADAKRGDIGNTGRLYAFDTSGHGLHALKARVARSGLDGLARVPQPTPY
jgi:hypothetical protein